MEMQAAQIQFDKSHFFVFSLGISGRAIAEKLTALGAQVSAWDEQESARLDVPMTWLQDPEGIDFSDIDYFVKTPGVPLDHPYVQKAQQADVPLLNEVDLFLEVNPTAFVVAITGTNGKSTTTALVTHVLKEAGYDAVMGGNIGTPMLSLPEVDADKGCYVLELSSYQLETLDFPCFNVSIFTNLTPDHLERHKNMQGYLQAKLPIFQGCDLAIMSVDDEILESLSFELAEELELATVSVTGRNADVYVKDNALYHGEERITSLAELPQLAGPHNAQNIALAWSAVCEIISPENFRKALESFKGLPHRCELVAEKDSVRFVNDSKSTNAESSKGILQAYDHIYWILGGKMKEGGVASLKDNLSNVVRCYTIGEDAAKLESQLADVKDYVSCKTLDVALTCAYDDALKEGLKEPVVLFSPCCASFDQFKNFEDRGNAFIALTKGLK